MQSHVLDQLREGVTAMLSPALEVITGLVLVVWVVAMHHTNSPTSVMSRYVLPVILAAAYSSLLYVSYAGTEDPYTWPLFIIRVIAAVFLYIMLWLIWMLRSGAAPMTKASETPGLADTIRLSRQQLRQLRRKKPQTTSLGSARGDELLAQQQKQPVTV